MKTGINGTTKEKKENKKRKKKKEKQRKKGNDWLVKKKGMIEKDDDYLEKWMKLIFTNCLQIVAKSKLSYSLKNRNFTNRKTV